MNITFDVNVALSWINCVMAGAMSVYSIKRCLKFMCPDLFQKVRATLGIYWCVLYLWIALAGMGILPGSDPVTFGRVFVRPAFTITLLIMTVSSFRVRNGKNGRPNPDQDNRVA